MVLFYVFLCQVENQEILACSGEAEREYRWDPLSLFKQDRRHEGSQPTRCQNTIYWLVGSCFSFPHILELFEIKLFDCFWQCFWLSNICLAPTITWPRKSVGVDVLPLASSVSTMKACNFFILKHRYRMSMMSFCILNIALLRPKLLAVLGLNHLFEGFPIFNIFAWLKGKAELLAKLNHVC